LPQPFLCHHSALKKYLVFTYYVGRPVGGAKDFLDSFDSLAEALDNLLDEETRYYQIVDSETMETVKEGLARFKNFSSEGFSSNDSSSGNSQ
jgi:hypothetical protein